MTWDNYPRDLIGYGPTPPDPHWPEEARIAVQFVVNYEEGAERSVLHGDPHAEIFLSEIIGASPYEARHMSMESLYEYGSRSGFWRLHRLFHEYDVPVTVFGVTMAMERHPDAVRAMLEAEWEIASHGYRWIDHQFMPEDEERQQIERAVKRHTEITGNPPLGWYTGRDSPNTRKLVVAQGGFLYDADSYADELPYWHPAHPGHLVVPYTLDANDMRFATPQGFHTADQFFTYLRDTFDYLYAEGARAPKMMSVGLHCRLAGKPGRAIAVRQFLDHICAHEGVWICRRADIAQHWHDHFPDPRTV